MLAEFAQHQGVKMWDCVPDPWHEEALGNACTLATRDFTLMRSGRLLRDASCALDHRQGEVVLAIICSIFLATLVPPLLLLNLGVAAVNLCGGRRALAAIGGGASTPPPPPPAPHPRSAAARQPSAVDVYVTSAALANALQLSVALAHLTGLTHDGPDATDGGASERDPPVAHGCAVAYVLFHVSALASAYSVTLLAFDAYLEAALPAGSRPPLVDARSAPHVCAFLWGGSCLAAFPAALQIGCSRRGQLDCVALGVRELADVSLVVTGFVVPVAGSCVSAWCAARLLSRGGGGGGIDINIDHDDREAQRGALRMALVAVPVHFSLWAPFYATVGAGVFAAVRRRPSFRLLKALAQMLAYAPPCVAPCVYARMCRGVAERARLVRAVLGSRCGRRRYTRHSSLPLTEAV
ncbi:G-protein coupled receptor 146-like isoform X2 [Petromyzon marinus]|uniref:G-protein coupled receptor 146-like isoform X2 n=1 Tax=Petromyzon marinus TaxID=7757 RepID=UPI003F72EE60